MNTFIYTLSDPRTSVVRYVGKSNDPEYRLINHCKDKRLTKNKSWIVSLRNQGLKPLLEIIDEVPAEEWEFWEQYWIAQMRVWGFSLNNLTAGGKGNYERRIGAHGQKLGGSKKGRILSAETREKMRLAKLGNKIRLGIPHSDSVKNKMSQMRIGKPGNPCSEATRKLLSEKVKLQWREGRAHYPLKITLK